MTTSHLPVPVQEFLESINRSNLSPPALSDPPQILDCYKNREARRLRINDNRVVDMVGDIIWNRATTREKSLWKEVSDE
ncbi:16437_t:CDS:2, partial [Acaulospora morrowiae]